MVSDQDEQSWVWEYETEEGKHDMFMDEGEQIRFRVVEETFVDVSPFPGYTIHMYLSMTGSCVVTIATRVSLEVDS